MSELAAVRARDVRARARGRRESREPAVVVRDRVLRREDDCIAARELHTQVPRAAVAELLRRDLVHDRAAFTRPLGAPVRGARVDDHDLDLLLHLLRGDAGKAAREVGTAVPDGDDDRDQGARSYTSIRLLRRGGTRIVATNRSPGYRLGTSASNSPVSKYETRSPVINLSDDHAARCAIDLDRTQSFRTK